jgi:hypothetical protein
MQAMLKRKQQEMSLSLVVERLLWMLLRIVVDVRREDISGLCSGHIQRRLLQREW